MCDGTWIPSVLPGGAAAWLMSVYCLHYAHMRDQRVRECALRFHLSRDERLLQWERRHIRLLQVQCTQWGENTASCEGWEDAQSHRALSPQDVSKFRRVLRLSRYRYFIKLKDECVFFDAETLYLSIYMHIYTYHFVCHVRPILHWYCTTYALLILQIPQGSFDSAHDIV